MTGSHSSSFTRRRMLAGASAGAAGLALAACSPSGPGGSGAPTPGDGGSEGGAGALPPDFIPYEGVEADLPSLDNGTSAYFAAYPDSPTDYLSAPPGDGGDLNAFAVVSNAPVPLDRNPYWQAINAALGVTLNITGSPVGDYPNKFQTMIAGGDLPDTALVLPTLTPRVPELLEARFTDLGEFIGGDLVAQYPALANIPGHQWAVFNQKNYLVPSPRFPIYRTYIVREDITEQYGLNPQPADGAELIELMKGLSDPKNNRTATMQVLGILDMVNEMMHTPNNWAVEGGKFTKDYETESFADAINEVAKMWQAGYFNPDSFSANIKSGGSELYASGASPLMPNPANWGSLAGVALRANPEAKTYCVTLPSWDGSDTVVERWMGIGSPYHIGIPKTDPERVKLILKVIDALAAPFGTAEYLTFKYGTEGTHWNRGDDGSIVTTEAWASERVGGVTYVGAPAQVHYAPWPEIAKGEYETEAADLDHPLPQPQLGLNSETDTSDGTALTARMVDVMSGVIQGRGTMDDWTTAVADWRKEGGDQIRGEYEEAYAAVN